MGEFDRYYSAVGLRPGAAKDEAKKAYRDLAQVWHPDRFSHSPRLQKKAQENLTRINAAFEVLKDYDPPPQAPDQARLSDTFSAIIGIGDLLKTGQHKQPTGSAPRPRPRRARKPGVVGLGPIERSGVYRVRRRTSRGFRRPLVITVIVMALALLLAVTALMMY
jgi:hypothetical protein